MILRSLITSLSAAAASAAMALTVSVTAPGNLPELIDADAAKATASLTLTGCINASDLHYVASAMPALRSLDLKDAAIAAETNQRLASNHQSYKADELPAYVLAGCGITDITLPASLKSIGDGALMSTNIVSVVIPQGVTAIGQAAMADCRSLTSVTVPSTVTSVGSHTFDGCTALASASFAPAALPDYAFRRCESLNQVDVKDVTAIGDGAFAGCGMLAEISFGQSLKSVGDGAFYKSGLREADFSDTRLATIGNYAFAKCADLVTVRLPQSVTHIGKGAFFDDAAMAKVNIPSGVKNLDDFVLKGAKSVTDGENLIPAAADTIGRYAMAGLEGVRSVTIPATVQHISSNAMQQLTALESIDARASEAVPSLGENVWAGINQSQVTLYVDPALETEFTAAPQWSDFSIVTSGTSTGIAQDEMGSEELSLTMDGTVAMLRSSQPMGHVMLYDVSGRMLMFRNLGGETVAAIDLGGYTDRIFVISVMISGCNDVKAFKVMK